MPAQDTYKGLHSVVLSHITYGRPAIISGYIPQVNDALRTISDNIVGSVQTTIIDVYHPDDYEQAQYTHHKTRMVVVSMPPHPVQGVLSSLAFTVVRSMAPHVLTHLLFVNNKNAKGLVSVPDTHKQDSHFLL